MSICRPTRAAYAAAALTLLTAGHAIAQTTGCAGQSQCFETREFTATVTDFRPSLVSRGRAVTVTMRFQNKTTHPLILGYLRDSGITTDDQGNRYTIGSDASVRGIGVITGSTFDPKFTLQPGETSDGRFDFAWYPSHSSDIYGTKFEIDLTVRQIDPLAGNQFKLGKETAMHFRGFGAGGPTSATASAPVPAQATPPSSAPVAAAGSGDACAGLQRCFSAGPFVAELVDASVSTTSPFNDQILRLNLKIRNVSAQPLILAYKAQSNDAIDELGNHLYWGHAGTYDKSASGIGIVEGSKADPQFTLRPGEARNATFQVIRYRAGKAQLGTVFSYDVVLNQLEILPSNQIRVARDYALTWRDISPNGGAAAANAAGAKLVGDLRKKLKF